MTLLPVLLSILPLKRRNISPDRVSLFERLGDFVVERRRSLIWFVLVVTVLLLSGIPRLEFSDNWTTQFDERYQFRRDTDFISNNLTGLNSMDYSLESGREGGVTDPEYLRKVEAFAQWFREQPETAHVRAFSDVMKRLNRNMNEDKQEFYRLPDNAELAAQYLLLYELSVPFGADLNDRIDVAKSSTRLTATVRGISASELKELDQRAESWLRANIPQFAAKATGMIMIFAYLTQQNLESMLKGTMIGMALISLILILVFRSLRLGLISLVPNFIPAAIAFGLWGHLVGQVGLAGTVMTVIAFGIVVDDTIHFMSKYLRARRQSGSAQEAVTRGISQMRSCTFDNNDCVVCGICGVCFVGVRRQCYARTDGDARDHQCTDYRFFIVTALADSIGPQNIQDTALKPLFQLPNRQSECIGLVLHGFADYVIDFFQ